MAPEKTSSKISRRKALGLIGAAGAAALVGYGIAGQPVSKETRIDDRAEVRDAVSISCVVTPSQTEGPYFVDEKLNRSDIRSDPTNNSLKEGVPLRLKISVYRVDGVSCTPFVNALVDIWQCNVLGVYSDVLDQAGRFDTRGQKFLRGYQVTDKNGVVEFKTVYPSWYMGRTVHIHFKVRTNPAAQQGYEFTSQLYFDESITNEVFAQPPYITRGRRDTTNATDGIFRESGAQLMLRLNRDGQSYAGVFDIGLRLA
jgi:protocatechuate 3,4-dioxygenase beta subunit